MYPVLFHIGSFTLYTYGLFVGLGFLAALVVSQKYARGYGVSPDRISDIFLVILVSAVMGARLLYVALNFDVYRNNWLDIFKIWQGGLVFFGGFIGAVLAAAAYMAYTGQNIWKTTDILSPGIALGHAVGRIGCFFAGCCYGKSCDLPMAVQFTHPDSLAPLGVDLHPTQIYEVFSNLILFLLLVWLAKRKKFAGMVFLVYILLYSVSRFVIEFFRGDFRGHFFFESISTSQGIGLLVFVAALILLIRLSKGSHDADQI